MGSTKASIMSQVICPLCIAINQPGASQCANCGAVLQGNGTATEPEGKQHPIPDPRSPATSRDGPPQGKGTFRDAAHGTMLSWDLLAQEQQRGVAEQGRRVAGRYLEQFGMEEEKIELLVNTEIGPGGISGCIAATDKRLILFKLVGTPDPVANEALWHDVRGVEWVDGPTGVTLIFRASHHNKLFMESLPAEEAQAMVGYAIDHGNRVNVKLGEPGSAPTTTSEPPQGHQGWFHKAEDRRQTARALEGTDEGHRMMEQAVNNPQLAIAAQQGRGPEGDGPLQGQRQQPQGSIQPLPQRPANGSLLGKIKPLRSVLHGVMRDAAHGAHAHNTPPTPITGQRSEAGFPSGTAPVDSTPQPPASKSILHNVMRAQTESHSTSHPFTSNPITTGPTLANPATYDPFSQPHAPNDVSGGFAAQEARMEELPTTRIGGPDLSAITPLPGAQVKGTPELDGVDLDGIVPFVPPSEEESPDPFQIKAPVPGASVPIRGRLNKSGVAPGQIDPLQKMKQLRQMLEAGLITPEDFERKKADILSRM